MGDGFVISHGPAPVGSARLHPLLFVHGAWHGAWCWERFLPWFAARGWDTLAIDLRHHGKAAGPKTLRRSRIHHFVEDLTGAVDTLDRPPVLVAHSMGTLVAQRFLETRHLPGAVLLAPVPLGGAARATLRVATRQPLRFLQANLTLDLKTLVKRRDDAAALLLPAETAPDEVDRIWPRLQGESYLAFLDMLFFVRARPPLVSAPVAVITGSKDRLFSLKEERRLGRAYGVTPTVISGGAHDLMFGPYWEAAATAVEAAAVRM
jgi:pimeloyl-ACP methyl ester carboxylesterase